MKSRVKNAVAFLAEYKKTARRTIEDKGCDSIMIGHTHNPEIILGEYYNTGDFCETCSFLYEDLDGEIKLVVIG